MATIEEDYVSFKVAKLLKEKGFNIPVWTRYEDSNEIIFGDKYNWNDSSKGQISAPTLQMAMKWLRKVYNIAVEVYRTACGYVGCIVAIPSGTDIKFIDKNGDDLSSGQYTKWEYACEATIRDYLENLETLTRV